MSLNSLRLFLTALLLSLLVVACGGGKGSSAAPPTDFAVAEGNGQVTITWTATPGVDYWLMYAQTATPINIKSPPGGHIWISGVTSPLVIGGLVNGQPYSFAVNARIDGGPGGAQTASYTKTPRLGGSSWTAWSGLPTQEFKGLTYGVASDYSYNFLAVGTGAAIYKRADIGTDVALWTSATTATSPWLDSTGAASATPAVDFRASLYALGQFIAVGGNSTTTNIFRSTDLAAWTASATAVTSGLNALATDATTVVAVGDGGKLWWSTDGATWTEGTGSGTVVTSSLNGVAYLASGKWAAVGDSGVLLTSVDGKTWIRSTATLPAALVSISLRSIAAVGSNWVAVGDSGAIMSSIDSGLTWTDRSLVGGQTFYAVNASLTTNASLPQFLAVGASGVAYTSADGASWSSKSTGVAGNLYGLWGTATQYVAVGAAGVSLTSK